MEIGLDKQGKMVALLSKLKTDKHIEVELEMDELGRCGEQGL